MNEKNLLKLDTAKNVLTSRGIVFIEMANGQLQIDGINYWATTEKWYDPKRGGKGIGLNLFLNYLKTINIA